MKSNIDALLDLTKEYWKADPMERSRKREVVYARMIVYKILMDFHKFTLARVGRLFGKNHATVLHAQRSFDNLIAQDEAFCNAFNSILKEYSEIVSVDGPITDVYVENKILKSRVEMLTRQLKTTKRVYKIIDGLPEDAMDQILFKLKVMAGAVKKNINPRGYNGDVYESSSASY
jgi:hypothetical protein|tara:strand:- start:780 stop:1304 length:525 start_codon:yes stop_codon:yes gene_type:complete